MNLNELKPIVEALVFASDSPVSVERLQETLEDVDAATIAEVITALNQDYAASERSFFIRMVGGGYHISTRPEFNTWIKKLFFGRQKYRLTQASMETLAIIAFKQPISRVDIAQIRGVNSDAVVGSLMERKLVTIVGRSEGVGRPLLYGTTPEFLKYFGINDLSELPKPREIEELFGKEGLPDEVAQLLAETDKQLSLPISFEGESAREAEPAVAVTGRSPLATAVLPPAADTAAQENQSLEDEAASAHPTTTNVVETVPPLAGIDDETVARSAGAELKGAAAWAASGVTAVAVSELIGEPSQAEPRGLVDTLPDLVIPGTTESEEGVGFYGLFADTPEISARTEEPAPKPDFDSTAEAEELEALAHLTEQEPTTLLPELSKPAAEPEVGTDTTELAAMEFNIREPDFSAADALSQAADTLPARFATEQDLGTTREFALLDGGLIDEESIAEEPPAPAWNEDLQTTGEIMLAAIAGMDQEPEAERPAPAGDFNLLSFATGDQPGSPAAEPAAEIDGWLGDESLSETKPAELDLAADESNSPLRTPKEEAPEHGMLDEATGRAELEFLQSQMLPREVENEQVASRPALPNTLFEEIFGDDMAAVSNAPPDRGAASAAAPMMDAVESQTEPERSAPEKTAQEEQTAAAAPPFFVPAPAKIGAGTALATPAANDSDRGFIRIWRKAVDWLKTTLTRFRRRMREEG